MGVGYNAPLIVGGAVMASGSWLVLFRVYEAKWLEYPSYPEMATTIGFILLAWGIAFAGINIVAVALMWPLLLAFALPDIGILVWPIYILVIQLGVVYVVFVGVFINRRVLG